MSSSADLEAKLRPAIEPLLEPGEELHGVCVASQTGLFKGRMVALATTDRRLLVQGLNRKFERDGEPVSIPPETQRRGVEALGGWFAAREAG